VQEDNTGTKHPAPLVLNGPSQFLQCIKNFITDRTSQSAGAGIRASILNSWNGATVRSQEVSLVHAPCYIVAISRMRSRFAQYKVC
jgi:hypothetical protein